MILRSKRLADPGEGCFLKPSEKQKALYQSLRPQTASVSSLVNIRFHFTLISLKFDFGRISNSGTEILSVCLIVTQRSAIISQLKSRQIGIINLILSPLALGGQRNRNLSSGRTHSERHVRSCSSTCHFTLLFTFQVWVRLKQISLHRHVCTPWLLASYANFCKCVSMSSYVTFIYIALYTIQMVSNQLHYKSFRVCFKRFLKYTKKSETDVVYISS